MDDPTNAQHTEIVRMTLGPQAMTPEEPSRRCDACGLHGAIKLIQVRTTNGSLYLCQQCLDDINRKNPAVPEERERCAKIVESYEGDDWPHAAAAAIRSR